MTKKLALEQFARDSAAIDWHERLIATLRVVVNVARNHFLTCAGFTKHKYGRFGRCNLLNHLTHTTCLAAVTHQATEQLW